MKEALKTNPQFFDGAIYTKMGAWQDYLILAMSEAQALAWLQDQAKAYSNVIPDKVYPREHPETLVEFKPGVVRPVQMVNVCTFGYVEQQPAPRSALAFYEALIDGTETLGGIGDEYGPMALANLIYILGALMRQDAGGQDAGGYVELWDHYEDLTVLDCLNWIKAECPELAPAIQTGINACHIMPLEG